MKIKWLMIVLLPMLLLTACSAPSAPPIVPTRPPSVLPTPPSSPLHPDDGSIATPIVGQEAAVANSRNDLAERLNIDPDTIKLVSAEAVDWPDGCLGVELPGVMCTMVITPGYRVILEAEGKQYEYHTNARGDAVRLAPVTP